MQNSLEKVIKNAVMAMTILLVLVSIFFVTKIFAQVNVVDPNQNNTITVDGDFEKFAAPDIATVSFSTHAENKDLEAAQTEAEKSTSTAVNAVKAAGIDAKDIQTTYYNASPRYDWNQRCVDFCPIGEDRKLIGYEVNETITVKIRDLSKVSNIIGVLGAAKVSDIQGPNFDIENRDELMQEARKEAIKEAKAKAKVLANELGVNLGKIVNYYDSGYGYPMPMMYKGAEMDGRGGDMAVEESAVAPTINEGQNRIYSSVSIVYKIR